LPALARSGHEVLALGASPRAEAEPAALAANWPEGVTLIVDHYGRDARFEAACRPWAARIVALDDLADRPHAADLLLDPTLGRDRADYRSLVPKSCALLLGPDYAPLRPEFAAARDAALARRGRQAPQRLLIAFGATDPINATGAVLEALALAGSALAVDVALGDAAPHLAEVRGRVAALAGARLHVETTEMALLMTASNCAIGASGSTSWERCCLGLPALVAVLAANQAGIAASLSAAGAVWSAGEWRVGCADALVARLAALTPESMAEMSAAAARICDGLGAERVADGIETLFASAL
jgi:UDP-2,4-diacetamido-2,4,6-trideoxy-beta-L-altropyranose hydrolase